MRRCWSLCLRRCWRWRSWCWSRFSTALGLLCFGIQVLDALPESVLNSSLQKPLQESRTTGRKISRNIQEPKQLLDYVLHGVLDLG